MKFFKSSKKSSPLSCYKNEFLKCFRLTGKIFLFYHFLPIVQCLFLISWSYDLFKLLNIKHKKFLNNKICKIHILRTSSCNIVNDITVEIIAEIYFKLFETLLKQWSLFVCLNIKTIWTSKQILFSFIDYWSCNKIC